MSSSTSSHSSPSEEAVVTADSDPAHNPELRAGAEASGSRPEPQPHTQARLEPVAEAGPETAREHPRESTDSVTGTSQPPSHLSSTLAVNNSQDAAKHKDGVWHSDGRVKNPVPKRLQVQGMDRKNGNFAVLHIDVNKAQMSERNAAAQRTSLGTEAAARLANKDGYQAVRRSRLVWKPSDSSPQPSQQPPQPSQQSQTPDPSRRNSARPSAGHVYSSPYQHPPAQSAAPPPAPPGWNVPGPSPHDTKIEQARLLTLLRSLHPVLVVDQLCKALAFFGGIPGAPPPADGNFPNSASVNGPGPLFIGWMAEIFPHVDGPIMQGQMVPPPGHPALEALGAGAGVSSSTTPVRKKRGRPKGSKSKTTRKDKGIRKSGLGPSSGALPASVDVSHTNPADNVSAIPLELGETSQSHIEPESTPTRPDATQQAEPDSSIISTPGSKRRGRPKGSKNRPRSEGDGHRGVEGANPVSASEASQHSVQPSSTQVSATSQGTAATSPEQSRAAFSTPRQQAPTGPARTNVSAQAPVAGLHAPRPVTAAPAQHPRPQSGADTGAAQVGQQGKTSAKAASRKRKAARPAQSGEQESANAAANAHGMQSQAQAMPGTAAMGQGPQAKRRRTSKETSQGPVIGSVDSQASGVEMSTSPAMNLNSSSARNRLPTAKHNSSQLAPNQQQQQLQAQQPQRAQQQGQNKQQNQYLQQQRQQQQQSPNVASVSKQQQQQQQQGPMNNISGPPRAGQQPQGVYGAQQQQQANMTSQAFYAQQRQMGNQFPHMGQNMPGFQQQSMRRPSAGRGQQPSTAAPAASMAQFPGAGFDGQTYMNIDYSGVHGQQQAAAAAAAFGNQLDPAARDNRYGGMNGRR